MNRRRKWEPTLGQALVMVALMAAFGAFVGWWAAVTVMPV